MKRKQPRKDGPNKKKTGAEEGATNTPPHMEIPMNASTIPKPEPELEPEPVPEPAIQPGPQPQPEPIIELGPKPPELIGGFVAAFETAEKINEKQKEAAKVEIKACEEVEIDLAIRRFVESVVVRAQEKEAVPELKKDVIILRIVLLLKFCSK
ncbi:hypothetical protein PIB30_015921 [Stylosanthes scabra]|uniref:Uncharacterized protein n=1 Tax=Stylosanthes scabra TaxID=79078 RepID=A0ABU6U6A4_9FABA|nr:hypothetical protein [Stylosanthes scabra]